MCISSIYFLFIYCFLFPSSRCWKQGAMSMLGSKQDILSAMALDVEDLDRSAFEQSAFEDIEEYTLALRVLLKNLDNFLTENNLNSWGNQRHVIPYGWSYYLVGPYLHPPKCHVFRWWLQLFYPSRGNFSLPLLDDEKGKLEEYTFVERQSCRVLSWFYPVWQGFIICLPLSPFYNHVSVNVTRLIYFIFCFCCGICLRFVICCFSFHRYFCGGSSLLSMILVSIEMWYIFEISRFTSFCSALY